MFEELDAKVKLSLCLNNYAARHEDVWEEWLCRISFLDLDTSWK
jgi:hypothetical protein